MTGSWLVATWAGGGNVHPMLSLAERLRARGHRVGAVAGASLVPTLTAAGIEMAGVADGWLPGAQDVSDAVIAFPPDAILIDYMLTGALCGAELTGRPTVALVHTLYTELLVDGAPHPMGMAGSLAATNELRGRLKLPAIGGFSDLLSRAHQVLVTAPRELDAPGEVPPNVAYVGGLFPDSQPDRAWRPPDGDAPLVVVSVGTAGDDAARESDLLGRIVEAVAELPVRALVTLPDYLDRATLRPHENVTLSGYVPHTVVFPRADLLVTHAGLGSVVAALAWGVPMVCLPLGRDQPDNARAVVRLGAGSCLRPDAPVHEIRDAIAEQLDSGRRVRIAPNPTRAADLLEAVLGSRT